MNYANITDAVKARLTTLTAMHIVIAIAAVQVLLWTLIPALTFHNVPLDVAENIAWGREWQIGYYKHPPLQAWLTGLALFGSGGAKWPIYLLSQLAIVTCFVAIWQMGRDVVDDNGRLFAVAFFSLVYYANIPTPEFNANVLQMPFWALAPWLLWRGINSDSLGWWVALGATMALAVYTKYSAIFLAGSLGIAALSVPQGRAAFRGLGLYASMAVTLVMISPHIVWLTQNDFLPFQYAEGRSAPLAGFARFTGPFMFLAAQFADHLGALAFMVSGMAGRIITRVRFEWRVWRWWLPFKDWHPSQMTPAERFILISAFAPVVLTVLFSVIQGMALRDMWGAPMFTYTGLAAAIWLRPYMQRLRQALMITVWAVLFVGAPLGVGIATLAGPLVGAKPMRTAYPGPELAAKLEALWEARTGRSLTITVGPTWETGVLSAYASKHPSALVDADFTKSPWISKRRLSVEGALVIWPSDQRLGVPANLAKLKPFAGMGSIEAPYANDDRNASINWAIVPPAGSSSLKNRLSKSDDASRLTKDKTTAQP
ncbi:MAG: glycosyltransferase family 39 protein [Alphaproteobacteria bacterium]